jgi:hypothetical protein
VDPPPKMYEIGTLEGALEIVLSGFSTSSNFFGVESGVAFNVGINFRIPVHRPSDFVGIVFFYLRVDL